jgi:hypothetical protein
MSEHGVVDEDRILSGSNKDKKFLPADYAPNPWSVICGRQRECFRHGTFVRASSFRVMSKSDGFLFLKGQPFCV